MESNSGETNSKVVPAQPQAASDNTVNNSYRHVEEDGMSIASGRSFSTRDSRHDGRGYRTEEKNSHSRRDDLYNNNRNNNDDRRRSFQRSISRSCSVNRNRGPYHPARSQSRDRSMGRPRRYDRSDSFHGSPRRSIERGFSSQRRARSNSRGRNRFDNYRGNRSISKSRDLSPSRTRSETVEREWPPCFETDGSAFVFDTRSAMFYESQSNFFYDPKSKLYYGNKKGAYFRYDETQDPPFVEFQKMTPAPATEGNEAETNEDLSKATAPAAKPKPTIAIKLKSKKLKPPKLPAVQPKVTPVVPKVEKERIANIEKWTEKQAEVKATSSTCSMSFVSDFPDNIRKTAKGEPICTICKRKFPNIEKLRLHEKVSELHKSNLAKLARANASSDNSSAGKRKDAPHTNYTDRAQKRRELHGNEGSLNKPELNSEQASQGASTASDSLGSTNIGNQMLKKMGWQANASSGSQDSIRKDWQRIETLASAGPLPPPN